MIDYKGRDVHEALEEVKAQKEKLEEEVRIKTDLCNNVKKAQDELTTKLQEAKLQSEKQAQELSAKSEELSTLSQLHRDLKSSFQEKESAFKHLNSAIEKLRYEYGEKLQKSEKQNKELVLALEDAKTGSESLKSGLDSRNMEIDDLKRIVSLKDKRIEEISDKAKTARDLIQRDEVISKLEEQHTDVKDQLKWKNEQFQHLEEAHKKLQDNFKSSKTEWEKEKSLLLQEISSLQTSLDSQTRTSENLQTQLRVCNQALAHEQSSKKLLEVEIAEYKSRYDDIFFECNEAKLMIEKLSHKRDKEVAELRDTLAAKDSLSKEMGYKLGHLEQENKDLIASLKEFQESQISNGGNTGALKKLQKKYNSLEQAHKKCSEKLKVEVELKSELDKLRKEIDDYSTKLKDRSEQVMQLQEELKSCHSLPEVQSDEMPSLVPVLKAQLSELNTKLEQKNTEHKDIVLRLKEELEVKNNVICEVNLNLTKKCEDVESLMKKVELFDDTKRQLLAESHKVVELEKGKLFVESKNMQLEVENQSLRYRVNEQNEKNVDFEQQLVSLETVLTERTEAHKKETEKNLEVIEEKESSIKRLLRVTEEKNQRIEELVKEMTNSLKISEEKQKLENEVSCLCEKVKVKDEFLLKSTQRAEELEDLLRVNKLETEKLMDENTFLVNKLEAQNRKMEELEKEMTNALTISEEKQKLENDFSCLCEEVKVKDESLLKSTQRAAELEDLLRVNKLETKKLMDENTFLVNNLEAQNRRIEELEKEITNALTITEEKQKLEDEFSGLCEQVKFKDESLLKSTRRAEELDNLLRTTKLETENLRDEHTRLVNNLEAQNRRIEELAKEKKNALTSSEEKQIEIDVIHQDLHKKEDEISCLSEKIKLKDESLLKLTQRAKELEDLLRVTKLDTENLRDENIRLVNNLEAQNWRIEELLKEKTNALMISEEKQKLENEFSSLCEQVKVKDESLLKSSQRAEELEDLLRVNKLKTEKLMEEKTCLVNSLEAQNRRIEELDKENKNALTISEEKQIEIDVMHQDLRKLEGEISCLCEKMKVKDESLLKSTQRAEELEGLLRVNKLETENLVDENMRLVNNLEAQNQRLEELVKEKTNALTVSEEKQNEIDAIRRDLHKLEDEVLCLCEKIKVRDESLLKSTQQAQELEGLLRVNKLETENLMDENTRLVNNLEAQNRRIEELVKEKTDALITSEEKQIEIDVMHQDLRKLEDEISCLCEKIKVKDEILLKSTQRVEELEELLRMNKSETNNLMDENTRLVNQVSNLEAQNQALCEDIEKILLHKDDLLIQMETTSKQMEECFKDDELTGMLEKMLQRC